MQIAQKQQSIFDGLMLSDAGISISGKNARISMGSKYRSFVEAMVLNLPSISWGPINERDVFDKRTLKSYHRASVHSHVSEWLTHQYCRWYTDGIKNVPRDIVVDEECIEWWYLGDGHLERKKSKPNYRRIIFAVDGFSHDDKELLVGLLQTKLGKNVYREGDKIAVSKDSMVVLAQLLSKRITPVIDYKYKYEFGNYTYANYHQMAMILRGPSGGRPKGSKDKLPRCRMKI